MGVKYLWKILNKFLINSSPINERIGVDASIWIYQLNSLPFEKFIYILIKRILILKYENNKLIFIFDGIPSNLKKETIKKRKEILIKQKNKNDLKDFEKYLKHFSNKNILEKNIKEFTEKYLIVENEKLESKVLKHKLSLFENNDEFDWGFAGRTKKNKKLEELVNLKYNYFNNFNNNINDLNEFSKNQIQNIVNRNKLSHLINKLDGNEKRIMSNYRKSYILHDNIKKTNNYLEDNLKIFESSSDEDDTVKQTKDIFKESNSTELQSVVINKEESISDKKKDTIISKEEKKDGVINKEPVSDINNIKDIIINNKEYNNKEYKSTIIKKKIKEINNTSIEYKKEDNFQLTLPPKYKETLKSSISHFKQILDIFNIPYIDSIEESDSQLAYLQMNGFIDSIISDDNDILLYGGTNIYKNWTKESKKIKLEDVNKEYTQEDLIKLSILLGSDYTIGKQGYGIVKAIKELKEYNYNKIEINILKNLYTKLKVYKEKELINKIKIKYLNKQTTNWNLVIQFIKRNIKKDYQKELILLIKPS